MQARIIQAEHVRSVDLIGVPNGRFQGVWTGREVMVNVYGKTMRMRTGGNWRPDGVACEVVVASGVITVEATVDD